MEEFEGMNAWKIGKRPSGLKQYLKFIKINRINIATLKVTKFFRESMEYK